MIIALMAIFVSMLKELLFSIAIGVSVILVTLKNRKINSQIALGIMLLIYGIPTILWFFAQTENKDKNQIEDYSFGNIAILFLTITVQIIIGYFVGKLIVEKKVLKRK